MSSKASLPEARKSFRFTLITIKTKLLQLKSGRKQTLNIVNISNRIPLLLGHTDNVSERII